MIDIIIPVHNAADYFWHCIETLKQFTQDFRLVLVDDFSDDETAEKIRLVAKMHLNSILIRTAKQRWFTRAVNLGLRMARSPRVVVLNSDCELGMGWLEELYDVWADCERQGMKMGIVGSVLSDEEPRRYAISQNPDYVTAHCLLCSMQALFDMSAARGTPGIYLDETKALNIHIRSDVALSWDLNAQGYATIKSFKSRVGHHGGKSWGHNLAAISGLQLQDVND